MSSLRFFSLEPIQLDITENRADAPHQDYLGNRILEFTGLDFTKTVSKGQSLQPVINRVSLIIVAWGAAHVYPIVKLNAAYELDQLIIRTTPVEESAGISAVPTLSVAGSNLLATVAPLRLFFRAVTRTCNTHLSYNATLKDISATGMRHALLLRPPLTRSHLQLNKSTPAPSRA